MATGMGSSRESLIGSEGDNPPIIIGGGSVSISLQVNRVPMEFSSSSANRFVDDIVVFRSVAQIVLSSAFTSSRPLALDFRHSRLYRSSYSLIAIRIWKYSVVRASIAIALSRLVLRHLLEYSLSSFPLTFVLDFRNRAMRAYTARVCVDPLLRIVRHHLWRVLY